MPPFYFIVVFWGSEHRDYFLKLCLPSLLSPGNIPALTNSKASRVVVVTTPEDWAEVEKDPIYPPMLSYIEPIFIPMDRPGKRDNKMLVMSRGHKLASTRAFLDRAIGVFVTPDLVLSDGSVRHLQALARKGTKVVLCAAVRFTWEGCHAEIRHHHPYVAGEPLVLPPRALTSIALRHFHSETKRYLWDTSYFSSCPIVCIWRVPGEDGAVLHSFSWAPLLVNYGALDFHDTETFEKWTLDGDYIHRNFPNPRDVYVVQDSDEITLISFTSEKELHFRLWPHLAKVGPWADWVKARLLRKLFFSEVMDPLKRKLFPLSVRWHGQALSPKFASAERRASALVGAAMGTPHDGWNDYVYIAVEHGFHRLAITVAKFLPVLARAHWTLFRSRLEPVRQRLSTWWRPRMAALHAKLPEPLRQIRANGAGAYYTGLVVRYRLGIGAPPERWKRLAGRVMVAATSRVWPFRGLLRAGAARRRRVTALLRNQLSCGIWRTMVVGPPVRRGKWYWELIGHGLGALGGRVSDTTRIGVVGAAHPMLRPLGVRPDEWGWDASGYLIEGEATRTWGPPVCHGSPVIMVAIDADAGSMWFGLDGCWLEDGDPGTGANPAIEGMCGRLFPAVALRHGENGTPVLESRVAPTTLRYLPPTGFRPLGTA